MFADWSVISFMRKVFVSLLRKIYLKLGWFLKSFQLHFFLYVFKSLQCTLQQWKIASTQYTRIPRLHFSVACCKTLPYKKVVSKSQVLSVCELSACLKLPHGFMKSKEKKTNNLYKFMYCGRTTHNGEVLHCWSASRLSYNHINIVGEVVEITEMEKICLR